MRQFIYLIITKCPKIINPFSKNYLVWDYLLLGNKTFIFLHLIETTLLHLLCIVKQIYQKQNDWRNLISLCISQYAVAFLSLTSKDKIKRITQSTVGPIQLKLHLVKITRQRDVYQFFKLINAFKQKSYTVVVSIKFSPLRSAAFTNSWYRLHNGDYTVIYGLYH